MQKLKKKRIMYLAIRIGLFILVLSLGTMIALIVDESQGLALADLPDAAVETMATTAQGDVSYVVLNDSSQPNGLYRSDDNGRTWQVVGSLSNMTVNTLATHPTDESTLYVGTAGGPLGEINNVWRSDDGGRTWHNFNFSLPANPNRIVPAVTALATDPNQPAILYVGTDGQGVYRFEEGRLGYQLVGGVALSNLHVKDLLVGPDSRLYGLTNQGLFATDGENWKKVETLPGTPISLAIAPADPQVLYAGDPSSGLYRSTDGGQSWQHLADGLGLVPGAALRVTALAVDKQDPQHVIAATAYGLGSKIAAGGIYESNNGGHDWSKIASVDATVTRLAYDDGAIYAATENGLQRYGKPVEAKPAISPSGFDLRSLTRPSGAQLLILALTVSLAGLVLLARGDWMAKFNRARHHNHQ